jgi:hypothetical protein
VGVRKGRGMRNDPRISEIGLQAPLREATGALLRSLKHVAYGFCHLEGVVRLYSLLEP